MKIKNNPKSINYGRVFRIKLNEKSNNVTGNKLPLFNYGLMALENGKLVYKHLNAIDRLLRKKYKKELVFKYNTSLIIPVTSKPLEARLGGGKAQRSHWECPVRKGMIIIEFKTDIEFYKLEHGLNIIMDKLPFLTRIVRKFY